MKAGILRLGILRLANERKHSKRWKFGGSDAVFLSLVVWTVLLME